MWRGTETDIDLFFSGSVREDDGEWSGGQSLDNSDSGKGFPRPAVPKKAAEHSRHRVAQTTDRPFGREAAEKSQSISKKILVKLPRIMG